MVDSVDYRQLGTILKEARTNLELTQKDIATFLAVTPQTISSWENGINKIDIDTLYKLCQKYDLDFIHLLTNISNNAPINTSLNVLETKHIKKYRSLNESGQRKTDAYMDDLLGLEQYRAKTQTEFAQSIEPETITLKSPAEMSAAIAEGRKELAQTRYARIAAYRGENMIRKVENSPDEQAKK